MTWMAMKRSTASAEPLPDSMNFLRIESDVADRREPTTDVGQPAHDGGDRPLGDRRQQLLVADVLDLVAVELAQGVPNDGLLVHLRHDRVGDEEDGPADEDQSE